MSDGGGDRASIVDLMWMGRPGCVGAWRLGETLIDCGPSSCVEELLDALGEWRPRRLLLTHIHFDHAGAAGTLVQRWPDLEVVVHEKGAAHLTRPERLEASARRVFGDEFDLRFGGLDPVPERNVVALEGGEVVAGLRTMYTPGHATHHITYLTESGLAFAGDVAGVRLRAEGPVLLPTPPPDIDLDAWRASLDLLAAWQPRWLALPHFGLVEDPDRHLSAARAELERQAELIESGATGEDYTQAVAGWLQDGGAADRAADYELVVPLAPNHAGLARWLERYRSARP